jgi:three-Cys-motif partner protein
VTDKLPTVWEADPHTLIKHAILRQYLHRWLPILTRQAKKLGVQSREILFIDGFAGPGEYTGGEPGSPVIALNAAIDHAVQFPSPVRMLFIEHRKDRFERLQQVIAPLLQKASSSQNIRAVEPRLGDCDTVLNEMLTNFEKRQIKFGPALAFLDQFGYGAVSMDLIRRILSFPQCEVFTYLDYKDMNRWITDPNKAAAFTRAFGGEEWRQCVDLPEKERRDMLLALYKGALKDRAGTKYVVSFLMYDKNDVPLYWLIFCTNNIRGIEEMKKAMWKVDKTGEFRFSDRDDPSQLALLSKAFDDAWLADELIEQLGGRTMSVTEVYEFVLVETPCYLYKSALKAIEGKSMTVVEAPPGRKPKTYPDEHRDAIKVKFAKKLEIF